MGNCLILEKKEIKIMSKDGKILSYQPPLKVQQVLLDFPGYAISSSALPVICNLDQETYLSEGQLYYLIPPEIKPLAQTGHADDVLRIKLVLSKQELKELIKNGGIVSLDDMMSQLQRITRRRDGIEKERCMSWKPTLESIPEENHDFF
ncbi:RNA-binding S4 domain-containing protein [Dioscorea alata]|uniref:RNA-binding S4 domain-containing protein n=1 Tax=Dioscorea alata TaxID=55571 RepID=A0ACB7VZ33_DIOAL|nr:RNA-binding S4 domain-containing protein [Dioscorea alata]